MYSRTKLFFHLNRGDINLLSFTTPIRLANLINVFSFSCYVGTTQIQTITANNTTNYKELLSLTLLFNVD